MSFIKELVKKQTKKAREKRAKIFKDLFDINPETKILDLGSEDGSNIHSVLSGVHYKPENIYIADLNEDFIEKGHEKYGFTPVLVNENGRVEFEENFFDIVYCSSVIEHVTVPKDMVWSCKSGKEFRRTALAHQLEFASEVKRLGKEYFVQTPYRHFLVESHTWLPFVAWLPRRILIPVLRLSNKFWVKQTAPDWYLLNRNEMKELFENAKILNEKFAGMTKSLIAVSRFGEWSSKPGNRR